MTININTRQVDGATIVDVSGRMTQAGGSAALRDLVQNLIAQGNRKVLLNLEGVSYIDSSGIGDVVHMWTRIRESGGTFKLLKPAKMVRDLLQMTKLYTLFDIEDDEAAAVQSMIR